MSRSGGAVVNDKAEVLTILRLLHGHFVWRNAKEYHHNMLSWATYGFRQLAVEHRAR